MLFQLTFHRHEYNIEAQQNSNGLFQYMFTRHYFMVSRNVYANQFNIHNKQMSFTRNIDKICIHFPLNISAWSCFMLFEIIFHSYMLRIVGNKLWFQCGFINKGACIACIWDVVHLEQVFVNSLIKKNHMKKQPSETFITAIVTVTVTHQYTRMKHIQVTDQFVVFFVFEDSFLLFKMHLYRLY